MEVGICEKMLDFCKKLWYIGISKKKERITMKLNTIYQGDFLENIKNIPNESVDLVVADPPYNVGKDYGNNSDKMSRLEYKDFTKKWITECHRVLKTNGTFYTFGGKKNIADMYVFMEELGMENISWIIWHYTQGQGKRIGSSSRHDDILMFAKGDKYLFNLDNIRIPQKHYRSINNMRGANPGDVWNLSHIHYSEASRTKHPTQKPHALYERMILASSNKGDTILDPFAGSGSALQVAKHTQRNFIGFEMEEDYIAIINKNLQGDIKYFNSYFTELLRVPQGLKKEILLEYLHYHRFWFLEKYHSNLIDEVEENIEKSYGHDILNMYRKSMFDFTNTPSFLKK